ncbi:hypothetical protein OSB04_007879 [Centaurea solstitialis]|uniref:Uncharacterized protein n=1 Tax=Centaurea solstitialis TaxID=347529 RepID=A0AA38TME7_9ASTR|nr:hypothetical protein OSB04_007879 [Centaurea solstitialis]
MSWVFDCLIEIGFKKERKNSLRKKVDFFFWGVIVVIASRKSKEEKGSLGTDHLAMNVGRSKPFKKNEMVKVKVMSKLVNGNPTAFIPRRQMLDGCLIANEVVHHAKKKKLNNVDFKKSLPHHALNGVWKKKWIDWICASLQSASTSVLINAMSTKEFPWKEA